MQKIAFLLNYLCSILFSLFLELGGTNPMMLRTHSWLCDQYSFLEMLRIPYRVPDIKLKSAPSKANSHLLYSFIQETNVFLLERKYSERMQFEFCNWFLLFSYFITTLLSLIIDFPLIMWYQIEWCIGKFYYSPPKVY